MQFLADAKLADEVDGAQERGGDCPSGASANNIIPGGG